MFRKGRKFTLMATCLAVLLVVAVGLTVAYLTDKREVTNLLGIGVNEDGDQSIVISLTEPSFASHADAGTTKFLTTPGGDQITEAVASSILPGDKIYKDPMIKNAGAENVYVRVKLDVTADQMTKLGELGLTINSNFVKGDGDYYYYTTDGTTCTELAPTDAEQEFFTLQGTGTDRYSMEIPATWKNSDIRTLLGLTGDAPAGTNAIFNMPITVEAIQAEHFTPTGLAWTGIAPADIETVNEGDRP